VAYKHAVTIGQQAFHIFSPINLINPNFSSFVLNYDWPPCIVGHGEFSNTVKADHFS